MFVSKSVKMTYLPPIIFVISLKVVSTTSFVAPQKIFNDFWTRPKPRRARFKMWLMECRACRRGYPPKTNGWRISKMDGPWTKVRGPFKNMAGFLGIHVRFQGSMCCFF